VSIESYIKWWLTCVLLMVTLSACTNKQPQWEQGMATGATYSAMDSHAAVK